MTGILGPKLTEKFEGEIDRYFTPPDCVHFNPTRSEHGKIDFFYGPSTEKAECAYEVGCNLLNESTIPIPSIGMPGRESPRTDICNTSCPRYEPKNAQVVELLV